MAKLEKLYFQLTLQFNAIGLPHQRIKDLVEVIKFAFFLQDSKDWLSIVRML